LIYGSLRVDIWFTEQGKAPPLKFVILMESDATEAERAEAKTAGTPATLL